MYLSRGIISRMNLFHALILGLVEGVTEFLPVSSTGHLILTAHFLGMPESEFLKSFEISIQFGAILAVLVLYWRSLLLKPEIAKRVMAAFLPTAAIGLLAYPWIKAHLMGNEEIVLWALGAGGAFLILFELFHHEKDDAHEDLSSLSYRKSVMIGLFQCLAMVPGVSRSAATILGGLGLGLKRKTIVEFSFLLAVPTMLAATGLDFVKNASTFSMGQFRFLLVGGLSSFCVAVLSIKFLLHFPRRHSFIAFGVYRIVAAIAFSFLL